MKKSLNVIDVKQSIRDLAKIYKPAPNDVPKFVRKFVHKYRLHNFSEKQLANEVRSELGYQL